MRVNTSASNNKCLYLVELINSKYCCLHGESLCIDGYRRRECLEKDVRGNTDIKGDAHNVRN